MSFATSSPIPATAPQAAVPVVTIHLGTRRDGFSRCVSCGCYESDAIAGATWTTDKREWADHHRNCSESRKGQAS